MKVGLGIASNAEETARAIERDYRMTAAHQWARELLVNSQQAGATKAVFGFHAASAAQGIWRMQVSDDGCGMDPDEIVGFFKSYGASGKAVGGEHDNMGIGAKTSLLPWNQQGLVVISVKAGEASMIHILKQGEAYGLRSFEYGDGGEDVVADPDFFDEEWGVRWSESIPDWIEEHGTVVILLGNERGQDTYLGNPERDEWSSQSALSKYLNGKFWELEQLDVDVVEMQSADVRTFDAEQTWRRHIIGWKLETLYAEGLTGKRDGKLVELPSTVEHAGTVPLVDGTKVHWFVQREGVRTKDMREHPASVGTISVLHQNEMFSVTRHLTHFRWFGVPQESARKRVSFVLEPLPAGDEVARGVYMTADRSRLLVRGGGNAGAELPISEWGEEFAESLPEAIAGLRSTGATDSASKREIRERLLKLFGDRWRNRGNRSRGDVVHLADAGDPAKGERPQPGDRSPREDRPRRPRRPGNRGVLDLSAGRAGRPSGGVEGMPDWEWYPESEFGEDERKWAGIWDPHGRELKLNEDHPLFAEVIEHWQSLYPSRYADEIRERVKLGLGEILVARIAHSAFLRGVSEREIDTSVRSPQAITLAACGLIAEERYLATSLGGKFGKKKEAA
jgi:hypothetical protein